MKRIAILVLTASVAVATVGSIAPQSPTFATVTEPIAVSEESEVPIYDDQRGVFIISSTGTIYMIDKGGVPSSPTYTPDTSWVPTE